MLVIERTNYTVLDLLGDIGGLASLIFSLVALLLSVLNYKNFDNQLVSQLFKFRTKTTSPADKSQFYKVTRSWNLCDYLLDCLPKFCLCCAKSKRSRAFEVARNKLDQETDIVQLVKSIRFFHSQLGLSGLGQELRPKSEIKVRDQFIYIDVDTMQVCEPDQELLKEEDKDQS